MCTLGFLGELKRRNVFRVAGVYAVVGWLLVQVAATVEEAIGLPVWFDAVVLSFLVIMFPVVLVFAWAFELTPEGIKRTTTVDETESITAQTASKLDAALVIALLVFAGAILAPRFLSDGESPDDTAVADANTVPTTEVLPPPSAPAPIEASIAVLPFADLSPDGDQGYFADGVSEELLNVLAKVRGMKVAGRTSSFAFKGRNEDLREIGRVLNVAHILEGSVRSQGEKVRVTAQLIQVSDGFHLWSETYDGDLTDIFAVQDDIAQQILVAMKTQLKVEDAPAFVQATRTDIEAYNRFLEARDLIFTRSPEKMQRALVLLNEAIDIDAAYAPAYAARAQAYVLLSDRPSSYGTMPAKEAIEKAQADVDLALKLDPNLAHAHAVLGLLSNDVGRPDFAISSLRRALELNPNSLDARNWLSLSLSDNGQFRDALDQLSKLLEIDPLYLPGVNNASLYAEEVGDRTGSIAVAKRYIERSTDPVARSRLQARIAGQEGRIADGIEIALALLPSSRSRQLAVTVTVAYASLGEQYGDGHPDQVYRQVLLAQLGERDRAVAATARQIAENPTYLAGHRVYLQVLSIVSRDAELIEHFNAEFNADMGTFATRLRSSALNDPPPFMELALAMRATGDIAGYDRAMLYWRQSIDTYRAGGSASALRDLDDARYWSIYGDAQESIDFLERAYAHRQFLSVLTFKERALEPLAGEPRYLALRGKALARINEERAQLDLPPLDDSYFAN